MSSLLVAASGGHLAQLNLLSSRVPGVDDGSTWVTFDTAQSRSMLADRRHVFVPYTNPRDIGQALRNMPAARKIIGSADPSLVVSTGNAIAFSFLPLARARGIPTAYIESAARANGPSLTGQLMQAVPGIQLFTQYEAWANSRWRYAGSIFDRFEPVNVGAQGFPLRVLVTLGTIKFGFRRLVDRVRAILPPVCEVIWQVGVTEAGDLGEAALATLPAHELRAQTERADVVIAHAGIGSALMALEAGKCPVLVARQSVHGEHVDDHQQQIAARLDQLGLAVSRTVEDLDPSAVEAAFGRTVIERSAAPQIDISL